MKCKSIIGFSMALLLGLQACQKDVDMFIPDPVKQGPDTTWYAQITDSMPVRQLKKALEPGMFADSILVNSSPAVVNTPFGMTCTFPPNCCAGTNGQVITGNVAVKLLLIKKKGAMISADKPTTSDGRLLVSGGEMFVGLFQNGQELKLAQGKEISIKYNDSPIVPFMKVFYGSESSPDQFNWLPADTLNGQLFPGNNFYTVIATKLRWINCDYFFDTTGIQRVQVAASLPPQYTNANTSAYFVFNDLRSVVGMYGNSITKRFSTGLLPTGKAAKLIILSKQGDDYYLGQTPVVTAIAAGTVQTVGVQPVKTSLADVKSFLETL